MSGSPKLFSRSLFFLLVVLLLGIASMPAAAATIHIDYTCTLHAALSSANKDKQKRNCERGDGADVIILNRSIRPSAGKLPRVDKDLRIIGNYHRITVRDDDPFLFVQNAHLTLENLTVVFEGNRSGKAMEVKDGKLTLINVVFKQCKKGIKYSRSHISVSGNSDICGLSTNEWVDGSGTTNISPPAPPPQPDTCGPLSRVGINILPFYGLGSGAQCQRLDRGRISNQAALTGGFIDAVDLWGYVEQGIEVCFPQVGAVIFQDASTTPRMVSSLPSYSKNGQSCANVNRAGIVVLVPGAPSGGSPPVAAQPAQPSQPAQAPAGPSPSGCPIHTTGHLKLRARPSLVAAVLDYVPRGSNLVASSRTTFWYQVTYRSQTGWIGGGFVRANC